MRLSTKFFLIAGLALVFIAIGAMGVEHFAIADGFCPHGCLKP